MGVADGEWWVSLEVVGGVVVVLLELVVGLQVVEVVVVEGGTVAWLGILLERVVADVVTVPASFFSPPSDEG